MADDADGADTEAAVRDRPRSRLSQADWPLYSLLDLFPIPEALLRLGPRARGVTPAELAQEMGGSATGASFRTTTAASVAYGLTDGGAQADAIGLTSLGQRLILPSSAEEAHEATIEALMRPRLMGAVLRRYADRPWPPDRVLAGRLSDGGYPAAQIPGALVVINRNVRDFHLLDRSAAGQTMLSLAFDSRIRRPPAGSAATAGPAGPSRSPDAVRGTAATRGLLPLIPEAARAAEAPSTARNGEPQLALASRGRVYLSVPMDSPLLRQLGEVLTFGGYLPVLPPDASVPALSPAIMERMRNCSAAVVDLRASPTRPPEADDESLMRIGAAVALCGERTVFLCPAGMALPPAVKHLPHVRYAGDSLDYESTMGLVRVFSKMTTERGRA